MIAHAEAQFALSSRTQDGLTQRDHLLAAQRAGEDVPELSVPPIPVGCIAVWNAFLEMNASRSNNGMGPSAIGARGVLDWQELHCVSLTSWEIGTVMALDRVALESANKADAAKG